MTAGDLMPSLPEPTAESSHLAPATYTVELGQWK